MKKKEAYNDVSLDLAPLLNALAHPARLQILLHLAKFDECQAGGIADNIPLARSTVSMHVSKLKEVGLLNAEVRDKFILYSLNQEKFQTVVDLFTDLKLMVTGSLANQQECCTKELDEDLVSQ
ncbi:transcriptional regulator [Marinifilum breve]|uniref:Transcriptional regulator n=1 Tax=Marinifilum breve TaxID=2184082 RepID=A0A2V3ZY65_9BACT|nr:metalloregulator ArsR/SmtB family transcription factor [Marinifilum breve]PXY01368.1 transcriptional regulator [Marinifilum breve]